MRRALGPARAGHGETNPNPLRWAACREGRPRRRRGLARGAGGRTPRSSPCGRPAARAGATLYVTSSRARTTAARRRAPRACVDGRASRGWWWRTRTRTRSSAGAGSPAAPRRRGGTTGLLAARRAQLNVAVPGRAAGPARPSCCSRRPHARRRIATAGGHSKWITSAAQRRQARWPAPAARRGAGRHRDRARGRPAAAAVAPHRRPFAASCSTPGYASPVAAVSSAARAARRLVVSCLTAPRDGERWPPQASACWWSRAGLASPRAALRALRAGADS